MNPVVKILSRLITGFNRWLDTLDKKIVVSIKQGFSFLITVFVIAALFIGYNMGKKSAKKGGTQIVEYTNQVFRTDIKKEHKSGNFKSFLETELISEMKESRLNKIQFTGKTELRPELKDRILDDNSSERKITPLPPLNIGDRLAEIDRMEDKRSAPEVKPLERKKQSGDLIEKPGLIKDKKTGPEITEKAPSKDNTGKGGIDIRDEWKGTKQVKPEELKPLNKDNGIIK